jgi:hypothetical protein
VFEKTDTVNGSRYILRAKGNYVGLSEIKIAVIWQYRLPTKEYVFKLKK